MIAQRLSAFCQGYLVAMVKGARGEELLNRGIAAGIVFWDINKKAPGTILFKIYAHQYARLRPFFFRTGTKGKILRKKGWPFLWKRAWRKKGCLLGMALFLSLLMTLSSFIWFASNFSSLPLNFAANLLAVESRSLSCSFRSFVVRLASSSIFLLLWTSWFSRSFM